MKSDKYFGLAICAFCLLVGCQKTVVPPSTKLVYVVPPSQDNASGYVDSGQTIEWVPSGQPFQVYFFGDKPCDKNDVLVSNDGTSPVICHTSANQTGTYSYNIGPPGQSVAPTPKPGAVLSIVGHCNGCTGLQGNTTAAAMVQSGQHSEPQATSSDPTVTLSCGGSSAGPGVAYPTPIQVPIGGKVYWAFQGTDNPSGLDFTVNIPSGLCSNYQNGTTISNSSKFCTVAGKANYTFTVYPCNGTTYTGAISQ